MKFILRIVLLFILPIYCVILKYQNEYGATFTTWNAQAIWMFAFILLAIIPIILLILWTIHPLGKQKVKAFSNETINYIAFYLILAVIIYIIPAIAYFTK